MIAQEIPHEGRCARSAARSSAPAPAMAALGLAGGRAHGSLPLALRQPFRRQGAHLGAGAVSGGSGQGRVRRAVRSARARCAGARLRRQGAAQGNRRAARIEAALLARARGPGDGAAWRERDPAPRFRGAHRPGRAPARRLGADRRSGLRRPWPQVSDLGAVSLRRASRGGQGSRAAAAGGTRRQGEGGGAHESGPRRRQDRRRRTGPPCSRAPR